MREENTSQQGCRSWAPAAPLTYPGPPLSSTLFSKKFPTIAPLIPQPGAIEAIDPKRTRSVRCGVRRLAFLGCDAVDAGADSGILFGCRREVFVCVRRMRPTTVCAPNALGTANGRMMAPLHAASAQSEAGPRRGSPDLTGHSADSDGLTNEVASITARNGIRNVDPGNTSA
jgi:hypothetical protein